MANNSGNMMAKGSKPKVIHTQFEEEEFEYADGGMMAKGGNVEEELYISKFYDKDGQFIGWTIKDRYNPSARYTLRKNKEDAETNLRELINNPEKLAYYRKNEYADGGNIDSLWGKAKYSDGGDVADKIRLKEIDRQIKEQLKTINEFEEDDTEREYDRFGNPAPLSWNQQVVMAAEENLEKLQEERRMILKGKMAHGGKTHRSRHRKKTLEEKAMEAVGSDTWFQLDKETQAGVIAEMISMGELPQRMAKGAKVAKDFTVQYELMDGKKVTETYGSEEELDAGLANFYLMNDVKDAIVGGTKPEVVEEIKEVITTEAKPKKKGLFDVEKATPKVSKSKQTAPIVHVAGLEKEIKKYDELKASIKNLEAEKEIIGGVIKDVAIDKYLEIYEQQGKRPTTIIIESGGTEIGYTVMDKYKVVTPEKETVLREYDGLLGTDYTFTFDNEILDTVGKNGEKIADIINDLIENSEDIPDDLKSKVVKITKKVGVRKGTIERLLAYDNPAEILQVIEAVEMLK